MSFIGSERAVMASKTLTELFGPVRTKLDQLGPLWSDLNLKKDLDLNMGPAEPSLVQWRSIGSRVVQLNWSELDGSMGFNLFVPMI